MLGPFVDNSLQTFLSLTLLQSIDKVLKVQTNDELIGFLKVDLILKNKIN